MIKCPKCKHHWVNLEDFLDDEHIDYIGTMAIDKKLPEVGLRMFNHLKGGCMTTMAFDSEKFDPNTKFKKESK